MCREIVICKIKEYTETLETSETETCVWEVQSGKESTCENKNRNF